MAARTEPISTWLQRARASVAAEDIDKARFGREVELSEVAQALLNRHCDAPGVILGRVRLPPGAW